jgi:uncharacterized protein (TIGR02611 family)
MKEHQLGRRRDTWGDDPEEIEASKTVAEFEGDVTVQRTWHEHAAWAPFKLVWRFMTRNGKRIGITIAGFAVVLAGIAMLVLPGPGLLIICVGLAILSTEYVWAQRMLNTARAKAEQAKDAVLKKKQPSGDDLDTPGADESSNPHVP